MADNIVDVGVESFLNDDLQWLESGINCGKGKGKGSCL